MIEDSKAALECASEPAPKEAPPASTTSSENNGPAHLWQGFKARRNPRPSARANLNRRPAEAEANRGRMTAAGPPPIDAWSARVVKRGREWLCRKPSSPQNHDVVGEGEQPEVAAAAVMRATSDVGALAAFDHRHDGLDL
jgi:hypothetical protein